MADFIWMSKNRSKHPKEWGWGHIQPLGTACVFPEEKLLTVMGEFNSLFYPLKLLGFH